MPATKGGTNQKREYTGHRTSNLRGKGKLQDGDMYQKRAIRLGQKQGLHSCTDLKVNNWPSESQWNHHLYQQQWMAEIKDVCS